MRKEFIIFSLLIVLLISACSRGPPLVGGDSDEHGCKPSTGYAWNEDIRACARNWELDEDQTTAAKMVVDEYADAGDAFFYTTVTHVETLRCPGCFEVTLNFHVSGETFIFRLNNWEIVEDFIDPNDVITDPGLRPEPVPTKEQFCMQYEGTWIESAKECVGISKEDCEYIGGTFNECASACRNNKDPLVACTMQCVQVCEFDTEENLIPVNPESISCTDEQKSAQACTLEYAPVCGDDGVTYGNVCGACASGEIDSYVQGECEE